jgi:hypothetical protein
MSGAGRGQRGHWYGRQTFIRAGEEGGRRSEFYTGQVTRERGPRVKRAIQAQKAHMAGVLAADGPR